MVSGLVWSGLDWSGLVWSGLVWSGLVSFGLVWSGLISSGLVSFRLVWFGLVWFLVLVLFRGFCCSYVALVVLVVVCLVLVCLFGWCFVCFYFGFDLVCVVVWVSCCCVVVGFCRFVLLLFRVCGFGVVQEAGRRRQGGRPWCSWRTPSPPSPLTWTGSQGPHPTTHVSLSRFNACLNQKASGCD